MSLTPLSPREEPARPARKPSVTFRNSGASIEQNPPRYTALGAKGSSRLPNMLRAPSHEADPAPHKRLSLSIFASPPRVRMPRKWPYGPGPFHISNASSRGAASPTPISTPSPSQRARPSSDMVKHASMSSPALVPTSHPARTTRGDLKPSAKADKNTAGWRESASVPADGQSETFLDLRPVLRSSTPKLPDSPALSTAIAEAAHNDKVRVRDVPVARPTVRIARPVRSANPICSSTLPTTTASPHYDQSSPSDSDKLAPIASDTLDRLSPTISEQYVWLCSRPSPVHSSGSPFVVSPALRTPLKMDRSLSVDTITTPPVAGCKLARPFVTRAMSTGRLAREFDEDGRVICLSVHSGRIIGEEAGHDRPSRSSGPSQRCAPSLASSRGNAPSAKLDRTHIPPSDISLSQSRMGDGGHVVTKNTAVLSKARKGYTQVGRHRPRHGVTDKGGRLVGPKSAVSPQLERVKGWFSMA